MKSFLSTLKTLAQFVILFSIIITGCHSNSTSHAIDVSGFTPGTYKFTGQIADVTCSDGSVLRKGYGTTGELVDDGDFLLLQNAGKTYGRGHLTADGLFHLSGSLEESGFIIAITLDGKKTDTGFADLSQAAWTTDTGLSCQQTSQFTAEPYNGGG